LARTPRKLTCEVAEIILGEETAKEVME